ncbi:MAG TPA: peptidylprolyl isomerase [Terriglobales bacterium]|nr:peptidylprolyl isomerase [Terriglobales bacterium]
MTKRNSSTTTGPAPTPTLLLLVLAAGLACSASLFGQAVASHAPAAAAAPAPDRVVARVNGVAITEKQLAQETEQLYPSNTSHGGLRPDKMTEVREKALVELEVEELAWQRAQKTHAIVPRAEVEAEFQKMRRQFGAKEFDQSLKAHGIPREQYLKELERRMTLERVFRQKVLRPARVSDAALRAYYQKNLKKFQRPEQVKARLILVALDAKASPDDERKAREKAQMIYQQAQAGKDFAALAEQYSDDFYKIKGGDLGWVHRGRLEPDFEKVAFSLAVGKVSEPFRTSYGYNLIKVEGRQPAAQMKFADLRVMLKAQLEEERARALRSAWVEDLKKGARVETVDPPAAPQSGH